MGNALIPAHAQGPERVVMVAPSTNLEKQMHRLFLAIWPNRTACQRLADVINGSRWPSETVLVRPENWHVTLHFIGNVPSTRLAEIVPQLEVPFDPFFITLKRRVSWDHLTVLEPDSITAPLASLHEQLAAALHKLHLPVESRPFRPHLTLARRNRNEAQPRSHGVTESHVITPIRWRVKEYALVESKPGGHAIYTSLCRYHASMAPTTK